MAINMVAEKNYASQTVSRPIHKTNQSKPANHLEEHL
jgi:hypothetical protein